VYIFDKKTTLLNRCDNESCKTINTNLPTTMRGVYNLIREPSQIFETKKSMQEEVTTVAKPIVSPRAEIQISKNEDKRKIEVPQNNGNKVQDARNEVQTVKTEDEPEPGITPIKREEEETE
jgi:hypothetical protein